MNGTVANFLKISARYWQSEDPILSSRSNVISRKASRITPTAFVLARSGYCVRHAKSHTQRRKAYQLIQSMYAWRGYNTDSTITPRQNARCVTLEAARKKLLIGTLTVALDSAQGLLADDLFHSEINLLRGMSHRVCEITKLAFDPKLSSKEVIASLFHLAYLYAHKVYGATDILIEVNPRHAGFYQRRLGFQQIGERRTCPRVDAPAVLLRVALEYVEQQIAKYAGSCDKNQKSLYPYFFSESEVNSLPHGILRASRNKT